MEKEEETQSGSPVESPRSNGRITVTVASAPPPPPPPPPQNTLTLALPIQQQQQSRPVTISGGGGGREDCWSEGATAVLIEAWGERYLELSRGNLKQKHWKDVADIVSSREDYRKTPKTDIQCKNRIDTVKKKYKLEKSKIMAGQGPSKWPFYEKLDQLIGPTAKINPTIAAGVAGPSNLYSGNQQVPMGIPMGVRSLPQLRQHQPLQPQQKQKQPARKRPHMDSDTSESESEPDLSPASTDSFPPGTFQRKRPRIPREMLNSSVLRQGIHGGIGEASGKDGNKNWGNSVRELTRAILKFGEAYEQTESAKLQQMVEMEKQRMKFTKEMELQRMQFFMNTQLELSQLKHRRVGNINQHHSNNHVAAASNHNNSDSSI
ncbi:trihelix transcription factor ASIL2-like [Lycium barbarum]|uniref:trihelix transcription factor ASIL2-like n=1 Tax=Lycium barbarum TaxID=112863 RepID=UPI00293E1727|nr:trihelix transcription factor ASIL2-like [Lycium barbarum]